MNPDTHPERAAQARMKAEGQRLRSPSRLRTFSPLLSTPCPF